MPVTLWNMRTYRRLPRGPLSLHRPSRTGHAPPRLERQTKLPCHNIHLPVEGAVDVLGGLTTVNLPLTRSCGTVSGTNAQPGVCSIKSAIRSAVIVLPINRTTLRG